MGILVFLYRLNVTINRSYQNSSPNIFVNSSIFFYLLYIFVILFITSYFALVYQHIIFATA